MEKYTLVFTIVLFDYISYTQAGLFDTFLKPNQGLDPLKDLNPLYQMNKAKGAFEKALIDNRERSYENDHDIRQDSQSKPDLRGFSDTELTTRKPNQGLDPLKEFNPLYQMNKAKGAVKEAIDNQGKKQQNGLGFWQNSQTKPSFYNTETSTPVDEKVAQLFPQGVDQLNKLQELNKLKEEGRIPLANKPNKPTYRPDDTNNKKEEVNILKPTKVNETKVLKPLTKNKFYNQVRPVIPDNERRDVDQTIYYIDL